MKNVAIITGGPSAERGISLKSAGLVSKYLDRDKYVGRIILIEETGWIDEASGQAIDLNDFSLTLEGARHTFDFAFLIIHGTPAEDGKLQGYFEMRGIPHSACDTLTSALTFNKQWCKDFLRQYDVPLAPSVLLQVGTSWPEREAEILDIGLPLFVKPNKNGSSYGVTKVKEASQLLPAIESAFQYDDEVIAEAFLDGPEYSCGVVKDGDTLHVFPLTELISENEFFDYEAKYQGACNEVTPAEISTALSDKCQALSARLYRLLNCQGMVRFDYILVEGTFYLLEANTIPGLSEASIIPQQAIAYGWTIGQLLDVVIENALRGQMAYTG